LGTDISGYINNIYELFTFMHNHKKVDPIIESRGFSYLAEDFSGIKRIDSCSYAIDCNILMSSFLKGLNELRKK
jgi:hypothetical protein